MAVAFRWLGVAGLEFTLGEQTLLVDPFFTRPSLLALLRQARVRPDAALAARYAPRAQYLLVTHPHYDHLLDTPAVLRQTGARGCGSPNTCRILARHGIPPERLTPLHVGDRLTLGPWQVEVFPGYHTHTPASWLIDRPLPADLSALRLPLRLTDYRMDACYSYRIQAGGQVFQVGSHPAGPAQALFLNPYEPWESLRRTLLAVQPRLVVSIHWEDFFRPLSRPFIPMIATRAQGLTGWPPVRRMDLPAWARRVQALLPGARVRISQFYQTGDLPAENA